ncbi:MAG: hypothetical protein H6R25_3472 [Proteobacteria bacterium]|nr:hypothetical protein [Pseudomonadota bacterium]
MHVFVQLFYLRMACLSYLNVNYNGTHKFNER